MSHQSDITINVLLDENRIPEKIHWSAPDGGVDAEASNAFLLAVWDSKTKESLRIDLWTKEMMVDEMADFYYQTMMTMADTFDRATHQTELVGEMKSFAKTFYTKFKKTLEQQ
jgi:gliding motility-associated protein GldC